MFKVTASTMGVASRAGLTTDNPYLYRGDPRRTPAHPEFEGSRERVSRVPSDPGNRRRMGDREERLAEYARWRLEEKLTDVQAKARLRERFGFGRSACTYYERAFLDAHPECKT